MITTWEQKLYRAARTLINNELLEEDSVQLVRRPLFFGKYKWTLHFAPSLTQWAHFDTLHADIKKLLRGSDNRFVSSCSALYFGLYANDPQILHQMRQTLSDRCWYSSLMVVAPECWHLTQPRPKNKGLFYHKYQYRIQVKDPNELSPATYTGLLTGNWAIAKGFFYCSEVRDVILFKLIHSQDILDITERS